MEHKDIDIVAVNDPFIEPHYAVSFFSSSLKLLESLERRLQARGQC